MKNIFKIMLFNYTIYLDAIQTKTVPPSGRLNMESRVRPGTTFVNQ